MLSSTLVSFALSVFGIAIASPTINRRYACTPDFEGESVTLTNYNSGAWYASSFTAGTDLNVYDPSYAAGTQFHIESDGQYNSGAYFLKPVAVSSNDIAVSGTTGVVSLQTLNESDSSQHFIITCDSCQVNGVDAYGCKLCTLASPGYCAVGLKESRELIMYDGEGGEDLFGFNITSV